MSLTPEQTAINAQRRARIDAAKADPTKCSYCNGTGHLVELWITATKTTKRHLPCDVCNGTGRA